MLYLTHLKCLNKRWEICTKWMWFLSFHQLLCHLWDVDLLLGFNDSRFSQNDVWSNLPAYCPFHILFLWHLPCCIKLIPDGTERMHLSQSGYSWQHKMPDLKLRKTPLSCWFFASCSSWPTKTFLQQKVMNLVKIWIQSCGTIGSSSSQVVSSFPWEDWRYTDSSIMAGP